MESREASGKSVEEAVESAIEEMGLSRGEVEVTVLQEPKGGFLGLGSQDAKVLVTPVSAKPAPDEVGQVAKEVLENLLGLLNTPGTIEITPPDPDDQTSGISPVVLDVKGEDLGILIGRRGQTLASLQHIVRLIVARRLVARADLVIDVEEYKARHYEALRGMAVRMAQRVVSSGRSMALEPMPANERRVVHLALAEHSGVDTQSIGDRDERKVVILPKSGRQTVE